MDSPTRANDAVGVPGQEQWRAACRRHHPNRVDVAAVDDGDGATVDGAAAATDDGGDRDGLDSLVGDDSHEDRAFHAFRGSLPSSRSPANSPVEVADDVVVAAAAAANGDGVGDGGVEVEAVKGPNLHQLRHHYSAMDGLASNDMPPLEKKITNTTLFQTIFKLELEQSKTWQHGRSTIKLNDMR